MTSSLEKISYLLAFFGILASVFYYLLGYNFDLFTPTGVGKVFAQFGWDQAAGPVGTAWAAQAPVDSSGLRGPDLEEYEWAQIGIFALLTMSGVFLLLAQFRRRQ